MQKLSQNTDFVQLTDLLKSFPAIEAAYLFGSYSDLSHTAESDIDIGLIGSPEKLEARKMTILSTLAAKGFSNIDLILFENAPIQLKFEIVHHNHLLFTRDQDATSSLFSLTLRKYWDFKHLLTEQAEIYKEKLLNG